MNTYLTLLSYNTKLLLFIAQMEHKLSIFYDVKIISFFVLFMFSVFQLLINLHLPQDCGDIFLGFLLEAMVF